MVTWPELLIIKFGSRSQPTIHPLYSLTPKFCTESCESPTPRVRATESPKRRNRTGLVLNALSPASCLRKLGDIAGTPAETAVAADGAVVTTREVTVTITAAPEAASGRQPRNTPWVLMGSSTR